jgi:hypothetical protein
VRQVAGRPTWLFIPDATSEVAREFYGEGFLSMLPPLRTPTGQPRPVTTALAKQRKTHKL